MKEIRNIQILRGIAALAVIFYHVRLWEGKAVGGEAISPNLFSFGEIGVDLFFVISGFIMAYIQPEPLRERKSYKRFMIHRVTRIYPPYWIISFSLLPLYLVHPELFNNYYHNKVELGRSFALAPQDYTPLLGVGWTLIHEVYFYILASLILIFGGKWRWVLGICWFSFVTSVFCLFGRDHFNNNRELQLIFSPFSLTFLMGFFIGLYYSERKVANAWLGVLFIIVSLLWAVQAYQKHLEGMVYPDNNSLPRFLWCGIPCALLLAGAVFLEEATRRRFASFWHLGNESYAIYLLHLPVIAIVYKVVAHLHSTGSKALLAAMLSSVVFTVIIAALFHRFVELPSIKISRSFLEARFGIARSKKEIVAAVKAC